MDQISIQLVGGEKDGWPDCIEVEEGTRPAIVYIWPTEYDQRMQKTKNPDARKVLADKLGILAYKYLDTIEKPEKMDGVEHRYLRHPAADKKLTSA